jgi:hypothetical protein
LKRGYYVVYDRLNEYGKNYDGDSQPDQSVFKKLFGAFTVERRHGEVARKEEE